MKTLLGEFRKLFKRKHKCSFIITNAFYTLEDLEKIDVIKTCQECGAKEAFLVSRDTLIELVNKFPNAFNELLKSYLKTWTI